MWMCKNCVVFFVLFIIHYVNGKPPSRHFEQATKANNYLPVRRDFGEFRMKPQEIRFQPATKANKSAVMDFGEMTPQISNITEVPKCANNNTLCENVNSYPYIHLKNILEMNTSVYKYVFLKDVRDRGMEELVYRHSPEGNFVCGSITQTVFPKMGKNKNNKWKYIINQENFWQEVRVETCSRPDRSCDIIGEVPAGYDTFCRQKYIFSKLLSLNDRGYPAPDIFQIPSACCCAYRKNFLKALKQSVSYSPSWR